jgi:HD-GYP domain-containing protein (c-di-GMP phosphodiesterase class II)
MVSKPVPSFYPIPIRLFFNLDKVNTDIYYKVKKSKDENEHLLILPKGGKVWPRIKKYMDEGVRNLFVDSSERLNFINAASEQLVEVLENKDASIEEKIDALEQGIEISTEHLLNSEEASSEIVRISKACVKTVSEVVDAVPKLNKLLSTMLANKSGYLYSHSMLTTYVANHIVRNISWGGDSHLEKLNYVLFFHDMFLVQIYNRYPHLKFEEELLFSDELTEQEKEVVLNHAKLAGEIIHKFPHCPMGADQLIKQHHGVTNGVGFAVKYRDDISPLAKVILIAEHFTEEVFKACDDGKKLNKQFVIATLKERYGKSSYIKIVDHLENIEI